MHDGLTSRDATVHSDVVTIWDMFLFDKVLN